jgi:hypothetical protein
MLNQTVLSGSTRKSEQNLPEPFDFEVS